jgi:hypothetical protein
MNVVCFCQQQQYWVIYIQLSFAVCVINQANCFCERRAVSRDRSFDDVRCIINAAQLLHVCDDCFYLVSWLHCEVSVLNYAYSAAAASITVQQIPARPIAVYFLMQAIVMD